MSSCSLCKDSRAPFNPSRSPRLTRRLSSSPRPCRWASKIITWVWRQFICLSNSLTFVMASQPHSERWGLRGTSEEWPGCAELPLLPPMPPRASENLESNAGVKFDMRSWNSLRISAARLRAPAEGRPVLSSEYEDLSPPSASNPARPKTSATFSKVWISWSRQPSELGLRDDLGDPPPPAAAAEPEPFEARHASKSLRRSRKSATSSRASCTEAPTVPISCTKTSMRLRNSRTSGGDSLLWTRPRTVAAKVSTRPCNAAT
mmetsp:Transcript_165480/g.530984  ORF Transcript_165480/g.530984 Transcript_165480/m.530984 type:complete len:261 (-) Transcript_165480:492-1274(-)